MSTRTENHGQLDQSLAPTPPPAEDAEPEVTVLRPTRGWEVLSLRELWRYRELVLTLVWRDIKVRYKQTVLGAAWALLQPGLTMVVFAVVFSRAAGAAPTGVAYPLFVYAGLLPWFFFSSAVGQAGQSVLGAERLITKVYFPRLALPFAAAGAAAVDFVIASGLLAGLMV